ncbi:LamG-like jellyroll fold domain-containing protein [Streptomyces sp. NPDC046324]|uniref:LamG-like jellyroll fold domain-containing protein n=1 Tax=Streptomyces sp. NPDC046324 TaxID=3154915 RepID=UPI0033EBF77E
MTSRFIGRRRQPTTARHRMVAAACALASVLSVGMGTITPAVASNNATTTVAAEGDQERTKTPSSAASENDAVNAAAKAGRRVEISTLRDERSQTFANPDGTFTVKEFVQPVRTRKDGKWVDIDTTLVPTPGGRLAPRAASAAMSISAGGDTTFATLARDGKTMSFSWPSTLPRPKVTGSTATYQSVLPDVDLVVTAQSDGFSHVLVVKSAQAATNPRLTELALPVAARGVTVEEDNGGLVAKDKTSGGRVFEAPQPVMWDSSGAGKGRDEHPVQAGPGPPEGAQVANVGLAMKHGKMHLTPDARLLHDKRTRYPVYIDPVAKTVSRTSWTWVSSANPGLEGWKFSNTADGIESGKGVGLCPANVSVRCTGSNDIQRQYYALPTGSLEGKTILKAEFAITLVHTYSSEARSVQLHRMNSSGGSAINSGTNWSNRPSSKDHITSESPTNPTGSCTTTNQNVRFTVTSTVQKAASSGWDTTTFGLQAASEDSTASWKRFCNNAALEVTYNRLPYQPAMSELTMDPGGKCAYNEPTKHYTKKPPTLSAIIWDPDHGDVQGNTEQLRAQFRIFWTAADGSAKSYSVTTDYKQSNSDPDRSSGWERFIYTVGDDIPGDGTGPFTLPQNTVIGWEARGSDGTKDSSGNPAWGPWSSAGDATRCEFILDSTKPDAPTVTSTDYPNDDLWHAGVGDYGTFTFYSPGTDVVKYLYQFTGEAEKVIEPDEPGRPAALRWMPDSEGTTGLIVKAVDQAGNPQLATSSYVFRVSKGRSPMASWALADPAGSREAAGTDSPPAAAGSGVTFGVDGPHGSVRTAASLDGTTNAYLSAGQHVVDTDKTFSVAAWVMLPQLPTTSMSVVSQDGSAQSGFSLGYDAISKRWSFQAPDSEIDPMVSWQVLGPRPVPGEWTHLVGVYDMNDGGPPGTMRMYINGIPVSGDPQERSTTWNATGSLQIGRALEPAGYTANFKGTIAGVQVFDRVVAPGESAKLGGIPPLQLAYWDMEELADGKIPDRANGTGLTLHGAASVYQPDDSCDPGTDPECFPPAQPVWGDGHLAVDGTNGYADRPAGLLKAKASFTVTARARLSTPNPTADETVLSLPGTANSAITVRYDKDSGRWQMALSEQDTSGAVLTESAATGFMPGSEGDGDHLALAYNAAFGEVRLFVNGQWTGQRVDWPNTWDLTQAGVQVGRSGVGTGGTQYFSGAIDEVRIFEGALDEQLVAMVAGLESGTSIVGTT